MTDLTGRLRQLRRDLAPPTPAAPQALAAPRPHPSISSTPSSSPSLAPSESPAPLPSSCPPEPKQGLEPGYDRTAAEQGSHDTCLPHTMPDSCIPALGSLSPLRRSTGSYESQFSSAQSLLPAWEAIDDTTRNSEFAALHHVEPHQSSSAAPEGPRLTRIAKEQPVLAVPAFGRARYDTSLLSQAREQKVAIRPYQTGAYEQARSNTVASFSAQRTLEKALAEAMATAPLFDQGAHLAPTLVDGTHAEGGASTPRVRASKPCRDANVLPSNEELNVFATKTAQLAEQQPSSNESSSQPASSTSDGRQSAHDVTLNSDEESRFQSQKLVPGHNPDRPFRSFPYTPILTPTNTLWPSSPGPGTLSDPDSDFILPSRTATPRASRLHLSMVPDDDQTEAASSSSASLESPRQKVSSPARVALHLPSTPRAPPGARQDDTLVQLASLHAVRTAPGSSEALRNNILARVAAKRRARQEGRLARSTPHPTSTPKTPKSRGGSGLKSALASLRVPRADKTPEESDADNDQAASGPTDSDSESTCSSSSPSASSRPDSVNYFHGGVSTMDQTSVRLDALSLARVPSPPSQGPKCQQCAEEGTIYCSGPGCGMVFCRDCWGRTHAMRTDWAQHTTVDLADV